VLQVSGTLEGDAALRNVDDGRIIVKDFTGPFNLKVFTDTNNRTTVFNGNVATSKVLVGAGGTANGRIALETGANLPAVEVATQRRSVGPRGADRQRGEDHLAEHGDQRREHRRPAADPPAANAAAATTSKVANLNIAGGATPTGTLDLGANNRLAVDYDPPPAAHRSAPCAPRSSAASAAALDRPGHHLVTPLTPTRRWASVTPRRRT
jgi:hypothetical protein